MGYPMVMRLQSEHARIVRHDPRCDWPDCINKVRWQVEPYRYIEGLDLPGDHVCTRHARAAINRIARAAERGAGSRADG